MARSPASHFFGASQMSSSLSSRAMTAPPQVLSYGADAAMSAALVVDHVVKEFGASGLERLRRRGRRTPYRAVDDVCFVVQPGEIYGVIGANGSGKSTLIRIICTLLLPDSGTVRVFGRDPVKNPLSVRPL